MEANELVIRLKGRGKSVLCKTWVLRQNTFGRRVEQVSPEEGWRPFNLYWRPRSIAEPSSAYSLSLKRVIARRFGEHDGSRREGPFVLTASDIWWLYRVFRDGLREGSPVARDAERLIECIRDNPQGVQVWIGEEDDA